MKAFSFSLPRIARPADFLQFCVWLALLFFAVIALVPPEGVDMSLARLFYKVTDGAWVHNAEAFSCCSHCVCFQRAQPPIPLR